MTGLMVLILVAWLVCLVCGVMVLIKLFQVEGTLKGIFGLICGIYTFIWGWINVDNVGVRPVMIAWSVAWVALVALSFANGAAATRAPGFTPGIPGGTTLPAGGSVR